MENITNSFINDRRYNYYSKFLYILVENKDDSIKTDKYVNNNISKQWKGSKGSTCAKMLLCFIETKETPDDFFPILDHDLEHIHSLSKKDELTTASTVYNFGNLTLLESKNSKNGHKGNRSIQDDAFSKKRIQYKDSSHKLTRDVALEEEFTEEKISNRTEKLFKLLNKHTDYNKLPVTS
jgi:hypothetical protein